MAKKSIVEQAKHDVAKKQEKRQAVAKAAKQPKTVTLKVTTIIGAILLIALVAVSFFGGIVYQQAHSMQVNSEAVSLIKTLKS